MLINTAYIKLVYFINSLITLQRNLRAIILQKELMIGNMKYNTRKNIT